MNTTQTFKEAVLKSWGKPSSVADAALDELFRHGEEISLDHDDQVDYAKRIGILAGELMHGEPESFIERFEREILNEED